MPSFQLRLQGSKSILMSRALFGSLRVCLQNRFVASIQIRLLQDTHGMLYCKCSPLFFKDQSPYPTDAVVPLGCSCSSIHSTWTFQASFPRVYTPSLYVNAGIGGDTTLFCSLCIAFI